MIGIYSITNSYNGKKYIGQSRNIKNRISKHFQELRAGIHKNIKLQNAYNNLGYNYFTWEIIEECPENDLDEKEIFYIQKFDSVSNGYNIESGGNRHKHLSEETKKKIAKWNLGRRASLETRKKISNSLTGKKRPPRSTQWKMEHSKFMTGKKMRLGKTGHKMSEETKKKMSEIKIGNTNAKGSKRTPEEIQRIIETNHANLGKKYNHTDSYYIKRGLPIPDKVI